jgi:hypothetical protein
MILKVSLTVSKKKYSTEKKDDLNVKKFQVWFEFSEPRKPQENSKVEKKSQNFYGGIRSMLNGTEKEGQRLLSRSKFVFKASLRLQFELENNYAISRVVVVLATRVTPIVGRIIIFKDLPTLLVTHSYYLLIV